MPFTELEIADHAAVLEREFWSHRRPSLHLHERMREGQRITDQSIELFFVRPVWDDPSRHTEEPIAKLTFVRKSGCWRILWQRADRKWHRYDLQPEVATLTEALRIVHQDARGCFFG